jgi:two-component system, NarL family, sensor kinase
VKNDHPIAACDAGGLWPPMLRGQAHNPQIGKSLEITPDVAATRLLQAALDALSAEVAVLDGRGIIVGLNRAWRRFGRQNGLKLHNDGIGTDYIAALPKDNGAASLRRRFSKVLNGNALGFRHYYWCVTPKGKRYFEMQVRRCGKSNWKRVFVTHEDVTNLKLAEDGLRKFADDLARSRETERRRLARELHDTTCQDLVVASLAVEPIAKLLEGDPVGRRRVGDLSQAIDHALKDLRTLSYVLHPPAVAASDLADALRTVITGFARRAEMKVRFTTNYEGRPSEGIERVLLSIVQEALVNIHRHSGSRSASLALTSRKGALALTIADHGKWREGAEGVGIGSMRERVAAIGGTLTIRPTRRGTRLQALVPGRTKEKDKRRLVRRAGAKRTP